MPSTYTRYPVDTERRDPGTGGKPPVDRRPTGGGGNGDDDEWKHLSRKGPRDLLTSYRFLVGSILAGDMLFFLGIAVLFFASHGAMHLNPRKPEFIGDWHPVQLPRILFVNTAILLLSSVTIELARRRIFHELDVVEEWLGLGRPALRRTLPWLAATLLLGGLFVAGQIMAWMQLHRQGISFDKSSSPATFYFYLITGVHALHIVLGILAVATSLIGLRFLRKIEYRQIAVDSLAWFWHTMGFIWLCLLAVLALS